VEMAEKELPGKELMIENEDSCSHPNFLAEKVEKVIWKIPLAHQPEALLLKLTNKKGVSSMVNRNTIIVINPLP